MLGWSAINLVAKLRATQGGSDIGRVAILMTMLSISHMQLILTLLSNSTSAAYQHWNSLQSGSQDTHADPSD